MLTLYAICAPIIAFSAGAALYDLIRLRKTNRRHS